MNTIDLRQAIVQRVHDKTGEELTDVIEGSIEGDERALPGLGVLFEMIWKDSSIPSRNEMVQTLYQHLRQTGNAPTNPSPS